MNHLSRDPSVVPCRCAAHQAQDSQTDLDAFVENGLLLLHLNEASGAHYVLHDLVQEYLRLHAETSPELLSSAVSRQALFLASPGTLRAYMSHDNDDNDTFGGPYSLVRSWATIQEIDPSRKAWDQVMKVVEEASTDEVYMRDAGSLLLLLVRAKQNTEGVISLGQGTASRPLYAS